MKKILIPLILFLTLPLAYSHTFPKDQALVIVEEVDGYKFEVLIYPKNPETGTVTELLLNATYLEDERPYIGGVKMRVEAVNVDIPDSFEILEFSPEEEKKGEGSAVQYDVGNYEITAVFATNGTYAVTAWPEGESTKLARAEFTVYPRSMPNFILFGFLGVLVLGILAMVFLFSRRRG